MGILSHRVSDLTFAFCIRRLSISRQNSNQTKVSTMNWEVVTPSMQLCTANTIPRKHLYVFPQWWYKMTPFWSSQACYNGNVRWHRCSPGSRTRPPGCPGTRRRRPATGCALAAPWASFRWWGGLGTGPQRSYWAPASSSVIEHTFQVCNNRQTTDAHRREKM